MGECTPEDVAQQVYAVQEYVHYSDTDRSCFHNSRQEGAIPLSSSRAWQCSGVSGSLARGTRDVSPVERRRFPMVLGGTAGAIFARISSLDIVRVATAVLTMRRF